MEDNEARLLIVGPDCQQFDEIKNTSFVQSINLDPGDAAQGKYNITDFSAVKNWIVASSVN